MPIPWPYSLMSGPPELPGLMAASVWMTSMLMDSPLSSVTEMVRSRPETHPWVVEPARFNPAGLPMATTFSPTWSWSESPSSEAVRFSASIFSTARSVVVSVPMTVAAYSSLLSRTTIRLAAPSMTWALVRI